MATFTLIVSIVGLLGITAGLAVSWRIMFPKRPGPSCSADAAWPTDLSCRLSIIVPARNEERNLPALLSSLRDSDTMPCDAEVLIVDDESEDRTAQIGAAFGCRIMSAGRTPAGWIGKCWACWKGAQAASGQLLLFLDADTVVAPAAVGRLLAMRGQRGGLVSLQPYHHTPTAIEGLSAYFNLIVLAATGAFTPWAERGSGDGAFGPCMLIGREEYFHVGGHEAVRNSIIEDMAFGRACRRQGVPVTLDLGRGTITYRMYPGGLPQLVEGWTKNLTAGARSAPPMISALLGLWLTGSVATVLVTALAITALAAGTLTPLLAVATIGQYLLVATGLSLSLARVGGFGLAPALVFPVYLVFFFAVFFRSLYLHRLRGDIPWKGRRIAVERARR